jgi:hypothetical protein
MRACASAEVRKGHATKGGEGVCVCGRGGGGGADGRMEDGDIVQPLILLADQAQLREELRRHLLQDVVMCCTCCHMLYLVATCCAVLQPRRSSARNCAVTCCDTLRCAAACRSGAALRGKEQAANAGCRAIRTATCELFHAGRADGCKRTSRCMYPMASAFADESVAASAQGFSAVRGCARTLCAVLRCMLESI